MGASSAPRVPSTDANTHTAMGTVFVAYGGGEHRNVVLETATELASSGDHDLHVYHYAEDQMTPETRVRDEIRSVVQEVTPYVAYEIEIGGPATEAADESHSKETKLVDAIHRAEHELEYVVMGDVDRGPVEQFTHPSMTRAVLKKTSCPVMLVPV